MLVLPSSWRARVETAQPNRKMKAQWSPLPRASVSVRRSTIDSWQVLRNKDNKQEVEDLPNVFERFVLFLVLVFLGLFYLDWFHGFNEHIFGLDASVQVGNEP